MEFFKSFFVREYLVYWEVLGYNTFIRLYIYIYSGNPNTDIVSRIILIFGQIRYWKNFMFTVFSFGQVPYVFGLLHLVILQGRIRSSFFSHLNSPNSGGNIKKGGETLT